jgi:hypothetical protein
MHVTAIMAPPFVWDCKNECVHCLKWQAARSSRRVPGSRRIPVLDIPVARFFADSGVFFPSLFQRLRHSAQILPGMPVSTRRGELVHGSVR